MNLYVFLIPAILIGHYLLHTAADLLNVKHLREEVPDEFSDLFDQTAYRRSQQYLRDNTRFGLISRTFNVVILLLMMFLGGFNIIDGWARSAGGDYIVSGLLFLGIVIVGARLLQLPFSIYDTFVIEERYGFNKTTPRTFVIDELKTLILTAVIGAPLFAGILWFFETAGAYAWVWCWIGITVFQVFLLFIAPVVIMPLFNRFKPLDDGELKEAIEQYARRQNFQLRGIYQMDGSRRSSKSNAFFTGFGRFRRIVLYDTLIAKHTVAELLAVIAHEMGHYKKKHVFLGMLRSIIIVGLTFYILSLFLGNEDLFAAFRMEHISTYAGLFFFGFLYTPVEQLLSLVENAISRRQEYTADRYAAETTGQPEALINGLKKLSRDNLSNLTPHPLTVTLNYGHPPVIERIRALRTM